MTLGEAMRVMADRMKLANKLETISAKAFAEVATKMADASDAVLRSRLGKALFPDQDRDRGVVHLDAVLFNIGRPRTLTMDNFGEVVGEVLVQMSDAIAASKAQLEALVYDPYAPGAIHRVRMRDGYREVSYDGGQVWARLGRPDAECTCYRYVSLRDGSPLRSERKGCPVHCPIEVKTEVRGFGPGRMGGP